MSGAVISRLTSRRECQRCVFTSPLSSAWINTRESAFSHESPKNETEPFGV
ncbi:hypothetical protein [Bacteroides caecimuris]|uniref:hypothetical protein n=1 Tax=Bacteroides caecimuris TaxID=1796613 RepID=UPI00265D18AD|nr:hypothetical protein [Bacteroides caecimuris]